MFKIKFKSILIKRICGVYLPQDLSLNDTWITYTSILLVTGYIHICRDVTIAHILHGTRTSRGSSIRWNTKELDKLV